MGTRDFQIKAIKILFLCSKCSDIFFFFFFVASLFSSLYLFSKCTRQKKKKKKKRGNASGRFFPFFPFFGVIPNCSAIPFSQFCNLISHKFMPENSFRLHADGGITWETFLTFDFELTLNFTFSKTGY